MKIYQKTITGLFQYLIIVVIAVSSLPCQSSFHKCQNIISSVATSTLQNWDQTAKKFLPSTRSILKNIPQELPQKFDLNSISPLSAANYLANSYFSLGNYILSGRETDFTAAQLFTVVGSIIALWKWDIVKLYLFKLPGFSNFKEFFDKHDAIHQKQTETQKKQDDIMNLVQEIQNGCSMEYPKICKAFGIFTHMLQAQFNVAPNTIASLLEEAELNKHTLKLIENGKKESENNFNLEYSLTNQVALLNHALHNFNQKEPILHQMLSSINTNNKSINEIKENFRDLLEEILNNKILPLEEDQSEQKKINMHAEQSRQNIIEQLENIVKVFSQEKDSKLQLQNSLEELLNLTSKVLKIAQEAQSESRNYPNVPPYTYSQYHPLNPEDLAFAPPLSENETLGKPLTPSPDNNHDNG